MKERAMDSELEQWRAQWLANGDEHAITYDLQARAKRDARRLRRTAAWEVASCAFGAILLTTLVVRGKGRLEVTAPAMAIVAFSGVRLAQFFAERRDLFAHAELATDEYMQVTYKRLEVATRWTTTTQRWLAVLALAITPWCGWMAIAHFHTFAAEPWRALVGFGSVALIFVGAAAWTHHGRGQLLRERARLDALVSQINT
jgi:hypothetical protein